MSSEYTCRWSLELTSIEELALLDLLLILILLLVQREYLLWLDHSEGEKTYQQRMHMLPTLAISK